MRHLVSLLPPSLRSAVAMVHIVLPNKVIKGFLLNRSRVSFFLDGRLERIKVYGDLKPVWDLVDEKDNGLSLDTLRLFQEVRGRYTPVYEVRMVRSNQPQFINNKQATVVVTASTVQVLCTLLFSFLFFCALPSCSLSLPPFSR